MEWRDRPVLVTGGGSFIGSHLVDALVARGARVRVADDLSSGRLDHIKGHVESRRVGFIETDLAAPGAAEAAVDGMSVVFHLAADHGGRGYVDLHQAACAANLTLDGLVFRACHRLQVEKVVYASSGCVYPNHLQGDPGQVLYLTEDMVGPPYDADNMYGWAKLMGEMVLRAYYKEWGMKSASCRYFTVYGERGHENHAVIAMIARAFVKQDPFVVWGDGCLPAGEVVISNPGIKSIADVREGEQVLGADGQYHTVLGEMCRPYIGDLVTIRPLGVRALRLTSEHPVLVVRPRTTCDLLGTDAAHWCTPTCWCLDATHRDDHRPHTIVMDRAWVPASEARAGDFVVIPRVKREDPQVVDVATDAARTGGDVQGPRVIPLDAEFAYFLGWYTAEGWTDWPQDPHDLVVEATIALAVRSRDGGAVKRVAEYIRTLGFRPRIRTRPIAYEVSFQSTPLARWLDDHVGRGGRQRRVASQLFFSTREVVEAFLDGVFAGDGDPARDAWTLTSVSRSLLEGVQILLAKVGRFGWITWVARSDGGRTVDQGVIAQSDRARRPYGLDDASVYIPIREVSREAFRGMVYNIETADSTFCSPFVVHNSQVRNWTHVSDIVSGTILAAEKIDDGTGVNLGTMERTRVIEAVHEVRRYTGHAARIELRPDMPTGPLNRVADNALARRVLGWEPQVTFVDGLHRTIDWYFATKDREAVRALLDRRLTER